MPFQNPIDPSPEDRGGSRFIQEMAAQHGAEFAATAIGGDRPTTYQSNWSDIADQFRERFPNLSLENAQRVYEDARRSSAIGGLSASQGASQDISRTTAARMPFGGIVSATTNYQDRQAIERIRDGGATQEDYARLRTLESHNRYQQQRGIGQQALDVALEAPAFGVEMALTSGASRATSAGIGRAMSVATRRSLGMVGDALRFGAGGAVQAALMPTRAAASVTEHQIPDVGRDNQGNLVIGGDKTAGDAFRGYLDHQIEVWSEMSGGAISGVLGRLPGAARAQAIASGIAARAIENPRLRATLAHAGYHGVLGEFLEERAGEMARGLTGVGDFGMIGNFASGNFADAMKQLAVEGLAFGAMGAGSMGASAAINRANAPSALRILRSQGMSDATARAQIMAAATSIADGTATVSDIRPGPLRNVAESVDAQIKEAEKTGGQAQVALQNASTPSQTAGSEATPAVPEAAQTPSAPAEAQTAASPAETPQPTPQTQQTAAVQGQATTPTVSQAATPAETTGQIDQPATPAETPLANSPVESPVQTQTGSKRATQSDFAALKMAAQSAGVSAKGSAKSIQSRLEKVQAGREALKKLGQYRSLLEATKQMPERAMPVPEDFAKAIASSGTLHASEKAALEAILSGLSYDQAAALREGGKPVITSKRSPTKGVSHTRAGDYAEEGFQKLKLENPKAWSGFPTLADYLLDQKTERAAILTGQLAGERATATTEQEIREATDALAEEIDRNEETRKLYEDELKKEGRNHGLSDAEIQRDIEAARAENNANRNREGASGQTPNKPAAVSKTVVSLAANRAKASALLTPRAQLTSIANNPRQHPITRQAAKNMLAGVRSLHAEVMSRGGLNASELKAIGFDLENLAENLPKAMWENTASTKNGRPILQDLAAEYERSGRVNIPESEHGPEYLVELLKKNFVLDSDKAVQNESDRLQRQAKEMEIVRELTAENPHLAPAQLDAEIQRAIEAFQESGAREGRSGDIATKVDESVDDFNERFHQSEPGNARERNLPTVATYDTPVHQQLIGRLHGSLLKSDLPARLKAEFSGHVSEVVSHMPLKVAQAVLQNVKAVAWHSNTADLTKNLAETSKAARTVMDQGKLIGGAFYPTTGQLVLDGNNKGESAREIYAHEFMHAAEGPTLKYSQSREWNAIFQAELADMQLTNYASTNATEGFAEFGRAMYGEGQGAEALRGKFPRATAFMEKHGMMPESRKAFEKPTEIFDAPVNDGPMHGDILLHVGEELTAAARNKIDIASSAIARWTPAWVTRIKEWAIDRDIAPAAKAEDMARKTGLYTPEVGRNLVTILDREQFSDKSTAEDWMRNGMATLKDGHWQRTGIAWDQVLAGATEADMMPRGDVDTSTDTKAGDVPKGTWAKLKDVFATKDKNMYSFLDHFMVGRHVIDEHEIGARNLAAAEQKRAASLEQIRQKHEENETALKRAEYTDRKLKSLDPSRRKLTDLGMEGARAEYEAVKNRLQIAETLTHREFAPVKEDSDIRMRIVSPEQLDAYRTLMEHWAQNDPEFVKRATAIHDRVTKEVFNASLDSQEAVGLKTPEQVKKLKADHPTYIETSRIDEEEDFNARQGQRTGLKGKEIGKVHRREGSTRSIVPPLLSAQNRYQKTASLVLEQIRRNAWHEILKLNIPGISEAPDVETKFTVEKNGAIAEQLMQKLNMSKEDVDAIVSQFASMGATAQAYFSPKPWKPGEANLFWVQQPDGSMAGHKVLDRTMYELMTGQQGNNNAVNLFLRAAANLGFDLPNGKRLRILPTMTKIVEVGATTLSPAFQINNTLNPTRDLLTFVTNTIDRGSVKEAPKIIARVYQADLQSAWTGKSTDIVFEKFKAGRGASMKMFPAENIPTLGNSKLQMAKQILGAMQAGESGPRFLEAKTRWAQLGWPEERIIAEEKKAMEAVARGEYYRDPMPYGVFNEGLVAASEVTGPFHKASILTRDLRKMTPFFQPSVAATAKTFRNLKANPAGFAIGMGIYLAAKLAHFMIYKDEKWYQELNAYDRYNNFVVGINGKPFRIQGARGLEVPVGGTLTMTLEMMNQKRPDMIGLLSQSYGAMAPPLPAPPLVTVAGQLLANEDWLGRPIVPRRDEHLSQLDRLIQHQGPYAARQLTGGRGELSLRGAGLNIATTVTPHRSVDMVFDHLASLEADRTLARQRGRQFPQEAEYQRLHSAARTLSELSKTSRTPGISDTRVQELRDRQITIARRVLGS